MWLYLRTCTCVYVFVATLYVILILTSLCITGAIPLCYELACETTYPVREGIPSALLTIGNSATGPPIYGLFLVPSLAQGMHVFIVVSYAITAV